MCLDFWVEGSEHKYTSVLQGNLFWCLVNNMWGLESKGHIKPLKAIAGPAKKQPGDDCSGGSECIDNAVCAGGKLCTCNAGFRLDENGVCGKKVKDLHHVCAYVERMLQQESWNNYSYYIIFVRCYTWTTQVTIS